MLFAAVHLMTYPEVPEAIVPVAVLGFALGAGARFIGRRRCRKYQGPRAGGEEQCKMECRRHGSDHSRQQLRLRHSR